MGISSQLIGLAANSIKSSGKTTLSQFLSQAAQGNIDSAIQTLGQAPGDLLNSIGSFGQAQPGDGLRGMNARSDAIQNWCWYCLLPALLDPNAQRLGLPNETNDTFTSGALNPLVSVFGNKRISPTISLPWYYVQRTNAPFRSIETESIRRNSHMQHFPTGYSVPSLTMEFFMDSSNIAHRYLKAWGSAVLGAQDLGRMENRGDWGLPAAYKKDINLYVLSVSKQVLLNFRYMGCWPSETQALELVSDSAAPLTASVTLQVEDVQVTVNTDQKLIRQLTDTAAGYGLSALTGAARSFINGL